MDTVRSTTIRIGSLSTPLPEKQQLIDILIIFLTVIILGYLFIRELRKAGID